MDLCVCAAVAAFQTLFKTRTEDAPALDLVFDRLASATHPAQVLSKPSVRQQLAAVSSVHPPARPTRGNLKQVFNGLLAMQASE